MKNIKPINFFISFIYFFVFGVVFAINIYLVIPFIIDMSTISPFIVAQIVNTILLFIPIFLTALFLVKKECVEINLKNIKSRLNLHKPTLKDFFWMLGSLFVAIVISGLIYLILSNTPISINLTEISPIELRPLKGIEKVFVLFMPISFFFNYVGEEILWRGYLYPRQELVYGKKTWIISGILHGVFHFYIGGSILIFFPILFAIPFVYSKTKNTYIVIIMHALLGAPTDFLLAIGILT